ncbi:hypothetical protein [Alkaliphilus oremlandii]|nr:hypothetical protein [Alkaliphilus oremlandii]
MAYKFSVFSVLDLIGKCSKGLEALTKNFPEDRGIAYWHGSGR